MKPDLRRITVLETSDGLDPLEDAVVPQGHRGPLLDRCQPSRCSNSVLGPEHLPI
ncbi:hypothetical protein ACFWG0_22220 [Streptomyces yangpuensis]|uniref:hypothetical protein n=1 Tax=Streptomyces yangpuensis TaxID=1648182 RepID=UPI0036540480